MRDNAEQFQSGLVGRYQRTGKSLLEVLPDALCQRDWMHKKRNVLDKLPKRRQKQVKQDLDRIYYAQTNAAAAAPIGSTGAGGGSD
ncbi:hypothetical protein CH330_02835 [candidate division WOR-3 bacterium JGI_Cruoil_03_51_56]|uniref:Uncharacterized protein n=1 Tax=candidate division WOR-3 bacterium JGI_Cruoil_03_51_56 TaxID=1973747 RepID=A0A235BXY9_UNCW3|nr:MAG: hypothetical protein CH330_02835 [candidate division WOR-3 bacterium JGI_Cruoil_03_51_56]